MIVQTTIEISWLFCRISRIIFQIFETSLAESFVIAGRERLVAVKISTRAQSLVKEL